MVSLLRYCRISAQSVELQPKASGEYLGALVFPKEFDKPSGPAG